MSRIPGFVQIGNTVDVHQKCVASVERRCIDDPSTGRKTYCLRVGLSTGRIVEVLADDEDQLLMMHGDLAKAMGAED